jgi:hypothetical protein
MVALSARADAMPAESDARVAADSADAQNLWRRWERDARLRAIDTFRTTLLRTGDMPTARADAAHVYAAEMRDAARNIATHYSTDVLPHLPAVDVSWTTRLHGPRPGLPTSARTKLRDRWDAVIANPTWARVERRVGNWTRADMLRSSAPPTPRHTCTYAWLPTPIMTDGGLAMVTVRIRTCADECPVQSLRVCERCLTAVPRRFVRDGLCLPCRLHRRYLTQVRECRSDDERAALTRRFNQLRARVVRSMGL